jgi:hypothetical protein
VGSNDRVAARRPFGLGQTVADNPEGATSKSLIVLNRRYLLIAGFLIWNRLRVLSVSVSDLGQRG